MESAPIADALKFPAEPPARFSYRMLGLIGVSLAVHAASFVLFHVVYPERVTIPPPPPQVTVLSGATEEDRALLQWIAAEDPAPTTASSHPSPLNLLDRPYVPSYQTLRTAPRIEPFDSGPPQVPPGIELRKLMRSVESVETSPAAVAPLPVPTRFLFTGALAQRAPKSSPALSYKASSPIEPTVFLVGIGPDGRVTYAFRQRSSGDAAADSAAEHAMMTAQFSPAPESPLTWGSCSVAWADDAWEPAKPEGKR